MHGWMDAQEEEAALDLSTAPTHQQQQEEQHASGSPAGPPPTAPLVEVLLGPCPATPLLTGQPTEVREGGREDEVPAAGGPRAD